MGTLESRTDADLEFLKMKRAERGMDTYDIDEEIARRQSRKMLTGAAPDITQARVDTVKSNAAKAGSLALQASERAKGLATTQSQEYLGTEQKIRQSKANAGLMNADTNAKKADDIQERFISKSQFERDKLDWLREKNENDTRWKTKRANAKDIQDNIRNTLALMSRWQQDLSSATQRQTALDQMMRQYSVQLSKETDDDRKQQLMLEQNRLADEAYKLKADIPIKQQMLQQIGDQIAQAGGTPAPQPATPQDPIQNSTPSPTSQPGAAPVAPQPQTQRVVIPTSRQAELRKYKREEASNPIAKAKLDFLRQQAQAGTAEAIAALAIIGE